MTEESDCFRHHRLCSQSPLSSHRLGFLLLALWYMVLESGVGMDMAPPGAVNYGMYTSCTSIFNALLMTGTLSSVAKIVVPFVMAVV